MVNLISGKYFNNVTFYNLFILELRFYGLLNSLVNSKKDKNLPLNTVKKKKEP